MSKTNYLFLSLLLLSNLANAQAGPAGGGASSTQAILLLILGILIIRLFYKSKSTVFSQINPMSAEKLGEKIGKFLASLKGWQWILYPMIMFSAYVFFIDTPNKKNNSSVKEEYVAPSSSSRSSSRPSSSSKTCSWCSKSFSGTHYKHMGKFSGCESSNATSTLELIGIYCSNKCCSEARRSSCKTCQ